MLVARCSLSSVHLPLCYARTGHIILALLGLLCLSLSVLSACRSFCRSDSISIVLARLPLRIVTSISVPSAFLCPPSPSDPLPALSTGVLCHDWLAFARARGESETPPSLSRADHKREAFWVYKPTFFPLSLISPSAAKFSLWSSFLSFTSSSSPRRYSLNTRLSLLFCHSPLTSFPFFPSPDVRFTTVRSSSSLCFSPPPPRHFPPQDCTSSFVWRLQTTATPRDLRES
jgi:hypothetical protein